MSKLSATVDTGSPCPLPAFLQLHIQMAEGGELAGEFRVAGSLQFAPRRKIPAPEQVGRRDHRCSHGTVLISALRPRQIPVHPKIEAHRILWYNVARQLLHGLQQLAIAEGLT